MTWWRWLILMLVVAASLWVDRQVDDWRYSFAPVKLLEALSYGCYYGQLFVLAALAVLLPGKPLLRLAVVGALATIVWYLAVLNWSAHKATWVALVHWSLLASDVALFVWASRWRGWRMEWPRQPADYQNRYQFSMGEMLTVTAISAFLLWLGRRWLEPTEVTEDDLWAAATWLPFHVPLHWCLAVPAMLTAWSVRRLWQLLPYILITGHTYIAILCVLTAWLPSMTDMNTSLVEWFSYFVAQALYVFAVFAILRALGFRWVRARRANETQPNRLDGFSPGI